MLQRKPAFFVREAALPAGSRATTARLKTIIPLTDIFDNFLTILPQGERQRADKGLPQSALGSLGHQVTLMAAPKINLIIAPFPIFNL